MQEKIKKKLPEPEIEFTVIEDEIILSLSNPDDEDVSWDWENWGD